MAKQKFYVVWKGKIPGVYTSWDECQQQIKGFKDAQFKSFKTRDSAELAFSKPYEQTDAKDKRAQISNLYLDFKDEIEWNSICVDAACSGNPGPMEYQGIDLQSQQVVFHAGPYDDATNNIGEFLAVVHALAYFKQQKFTDKAIYSDSAVAIGWVKKGKCNTKLVRTGKNDKAFELITRAEKWLRENPLNHPLLKWNTDRWGEIPADFGRK
ncbi:MAG: ribonuclease H family protein [Bacteroidales bacterium]|nr:ribonuclease H family protein [Bacteroidales bacterium]